MESEQSVDMDFKLRAVIELDKTSKMLKELYNKPDMLKRYRVDKWGLTQAQFSRVFDVSPRMLTYYESGEVTVPMHLILKMYILDTILFSITHGKV